MLPIKLILEIKNPLSPQHRNLSTFGQIKDWKNGLRRLPVWTSVFRVGIGEFDYPLVFGRGSAAAQFCFF